MSSHEKRPPGNSVPDRPEFAVTLGLLPPYAMEDVKRAYLAKVKDAHPDRGGDRANFDKVQHAYEQATAYLSFRGDRRKWIAARMEEYVAAVELVARLRELGAEVDTSVHDWVKRSFGDFASLTESIVGLRMEGAQNMDALLDAMVPERGVLAGLKRLELPGCAVTDRQALQLRAFTGLTHLDLSRTPITAWALAVVDWLPHLQSFNIEGTSIGWWAGRQLRRRMLRRQAEQIANVLHPANIR